MNFCLMANLDIIDNEDLVTRAGSKGRYMHQCLQNAFADHPLVGEIRGFGLIGAVEFVAGRVPPRAFDPKLMVAGRVAKKALARGVLTRALPNGDTTAFSPPLIISESEIDTMVNAVRDALDEVQAELIRDDDWMP